MGYGNSLGMLEIRGILYIHQNGKQGNTGTKTENIQGIPVFLENWGTSWPNWGTLFPGNMQLNLLQAELNSTCSTCSWQCGKTWLLSLCSALKFPVLGILGTNLYNCCKSPLIKFFNCGYVIITHFRVFLGWDHVHRSLYLLNFLGLFVLFVFIHVVLFVYLLLHMVNLELSDLFGHHLVFILDFICCCQTFFHFYPIECILC